MSDIDTSPATQAASKDDKARLKTLNQQIRALKAQMKDGTTQKKDGRADLKKMIDEKRALLAVIRPSSS